jgi:hypothetical protein
MDTLMGILKSSLEGKLEGTGGYKICMHVNVGCQLFALTLPNVSYQMYIANA